MDRVNILCSMNRVMMENFSRQTVEGLKNHTLFRLALAPFRSFLDSNVAKEIEKDRRVITMAAKLYHSGARPAPILVDTLLKEFREIDQDFLRKAIVLPVNIQIHYRDIEHIRQQRIELLLQSSYRILSQWQEERSFRVAVSKLYDETQLQNLLQVVLKLYAMETRLLSRSVQLPRLFALARDTLTQAITSTMEQRARTLAKSIAFKIYNPKMKYKMDPAVEPSDS